MRAFVLLSLVALAACAGSSNDDAVTVSDRAEVMDQELREMTEVFPDRIVITTPRDDIHRRLFGLIGHTFVSGRRGESDGFVREVLEVQRNGDVSTLVTETSSLDKVIESGHLHASQDWASDDLDGRVGTATINAKTSARGELLVPETVLFDAKSFPEVDGVSVEGDVRLQGGAIEFRPKIDIDADYSGGIKAFHLEASGDVRARLATAAHLKVAYEDTVASHDLGPLAKKLAKKVKLFESPKVRSAFLAGVVPVEFATSLTVEASCDLTVSGTVDATSGGTFSGALRTGIDWKKGKPAKSLGKAPSFRFDAFADAKVETGVELECTVALGLKIVFYEVVGAELKVGPYAKVSVEKDKKQLAMWWGAKAELEGSFEILGHELTLAPEEPLFVWPAVDDDEPMKTWPLK